MVLLHMQGDTVTPIEQAPELCLGCGHCVAACPVDAIRLNNAGGLPRPDSYSPASLEGISHLVQTRRSIRAYRPEPVDTALLEQLIDLTRWAPTAKNTQQVYWAVVQESSTMHTLASQTIEFFRTQPGLAGVVKIWDQGIDIILRNAPHLIVAHSPDTAISPTHDCTIAATTLELAACAAGLGTCWAGFFMRAARGFAPIAATLQLPHGHSVQAALMIGRPVHTYRRTPERQPAHIQWI
jgi:nitroreductase